ncbi:MAG TPA: hypothetical protein VF950_22690 [Planctomycetota bacterium]
MGIGTTGGGSVRLYGKFGKLEGESSQTSWKEKGFSDISNFAIGSSAQWSFDTGKSAAGGINFTGLMVSMPLIGVTPQLLIGCLKEKSLQGVEVAVGGDKIDSKQFMILLEGEVRMTSCSVDGSLGGNLQLSMNFQASTVKIEHLDRKKKDDINFFKIEQKNDKL